MDEDRTLSAINNYEANLKKQQAEQLRRNIIAASQRNPDQYAEAVQLSRMNNVPPAIVASDIDTYRNNSKLDDAIARKIVTQYKTFDEWLQNPDNAALVHDDIGALTTVFDGVENVGRSIGSGFALGFNGIWGSLATESATASKYVGQPFDRGLKYIGADPNSDADPFDDLSNFFQGYAVTNRKMSERIIQPVMKDAGTIERGVYSGIQSIASNFLGMTASVITKNPGVGLVSAGVTTGGQSASQALEKGLPVETALKYGITDAGIEVATEFLPITKFISDLKVGSSFGKTIANQMIAEVPGELMATTAQDFTNWIYLHPEKTFSDYANQLPEDLAQTFIATVSSVGLQTGTLKLVDYAISDKEKVLIEKAKIANLKTNIQGAKLNTRDPEKMREVLKAANPENKTATIDAGVLSHFYQSGLDPEEFFNLVPDARTQFENAELSGSDINIPYDEFVYAIANAPTPNSYDFMTDFIKVDPYIEPNMHEWDMKDPDQVNALIRDILDQTREQFFSKYEQVQQLPLAEEIERRFRDTLMNQDIMGEKVRNAQTAADEAKVLMEYVSTRLSKGGKAAEDTFMQRLSKDKFFLTGYKPPMPKIIGTGSSFYDRLRAKYKAQQRNINKPRKKDIVGFSKPKRDKATPTPLINALIKRGGVKRGSKIAAELEHIGITTKSHPRLYAHGKLQDIDNIPIDDLEGDIGTSGIFSRDADLNGYVDRSELLDKIRDESHGDYIRTDEQAAKEQQDEYDAQILDILDQEGVDITTATADDIDAALKSYKDRYNNEDGQEYYQDNYAVTKFLNNGQTVIELFQNANESSLMHEMGHLFLDLDAQIANHPEAPQAFKDEFNATLAWLGIEKYSDAQVKHHEQFARGFEAYLYTGETPNAELKSVFQRMVLWFTRIYKNIKQLGVKINPEMKAVFDRLLATDEAIEAQKTDKLFNVDKATMEMLNPKQQEEYLKRKEQALQAAKEKLFRKAYRQKLREKTEWWKEESDKVRSEVEADLMKQPVYQAIIKLQDGQEKLNQDMVIKSIDRGNTINPIGKFEIKYLPRGIISKEGTLDPNVVADMHGFKSAEQMFNAMKSVDPYTKAVQKQTEERMIARHGDMLNDGTIENEALAMVMAEDTKAAQVELKALTEKTGILYPSDGDFEKAARLALSKLKVDQAIAPDKYYRAALKSAREYGAALAKKNYEAAAESKRKEIINKHLYAQSKKAREETTKALDHFKKLDKKPPKGNAKAVKIDPDYHEKIWDLLDKYDFNPKISQKKELKLQLAALNQWIQAKEKDEDAVLIMPPELTAADGKTHYHDLTMNEFRAVRDLIDNLETQGRRKRKYIVEGKEKDLAEVTREMVDTAEKFTNPLEHPLTEDRRWLAKMGSLVGGIDAINTKIQQIMVKLDGGDNYGVWTRSVYEPMQRAVINQAIRMRQEGDNLRALMEKYYADDKKSFKDFIAERGGFTITREELISIAMHFTATEDNRAKLLDFYEKKHGWDEEFIRDVLTQMRAKDWQFVMGVRDLYESFWAETSAIEKRRFGYAPEKLEGLPTETFTTVDGTDIDVRGGYARIKYDSRHSFKTMANDLKDAYKELAIGSSSIAATKRGSMKERKASSGQAIRLDLDVIGEHIAEQVGIITMSEAVENTAKVLRQDNVQEVMHNNLGKEYKMMVDLWLQDVAAGEGTAVQVNGAILRKIRTNYTIGKLALKPLTALVQMSGIVQTMADPDLGVKYTLHGLKDFLSQDPRTTSEQIRAKSAYMQERKFTLNRDVADALNEYTNKGKTIQDKAAALMLLPMQKVQAMVDMVTWKAAYIKALDDRMDDADAIRYADLSVSRLQGSGLSTDQAAIERGTLGNSVRKQEAVKTGTVLFSYFNAKYNIAKNAKIKYDNKQISAVDLAASITLSFLVEGLVSAFLMGQIDWDKDEDGETTLGEATIGLGQMALYNAASTIPYGRTVASTIQGFTPHDAFTAQLVALGKFIGTAAGDSYDLLTDTKDLEDINWESRAKTTIDAIGVFFAIPSSEAKVLIRAVNKDDPELMDYLVYQK